MTERPPPTGDEAERLEALRSHGILDTAAEPEFDDLTRLIRHVCGTSIALMTLVDETRQWFKSEIGFGRRETTLDLSVCAYAIRQEDLLVVPDLKADPRFADHPAVTGWPYLRFYAGAPMRTRAGHALGTFCVADTVPRQLYESQIDTLRILSRQAMALMELRKANVAQVVALRQKEKARSALIDELQHRFRNNLQTIDSLISLQSHKERTPDGRAAIEQLRDRLRPLYLIQDLPQDRGSAAVHLRTYLHDVAHAAVELQRGRGVQADWVEALDDIQVSREKALPLGLIVNEFFANSFEHAFTGRRGRLEIRLIGRHDRHACLQLADDGPGFVVTARPAAPGLGLQLITVLSRQLGGAPAWEMNGGARLTLEFATG